MNVLSLDHLVLTVRSIENTVRFYTTVLGMEARMFGDNRTALHFGKQKINLHQMDKPVDRNVRHATPGSADICLLTDTAMEQAIEELKTKGVLIVEGPGRRTGATSALWSVYFYDPDENLVEVANVLPNG
jgi:catechol 2,3-dioxygenase-like lactoylglutathione lyase family enzyme